MQNLIKIIAEAKKKSNIPDQAVLNIVREYLQVLILKAIYQSKYGKALSFMGGTCLRICHDLKRYSEDLDFALDNKIPEYSLDELNEIIVRFLKNTDFEVDLQVSSDKVVQKSFIRVGKILHSLSLSPLESQKIHVKLEVDTRPVKVSKNEIETFFVTKFNEMFPILKHTDETMFAGKVLAILNREYTKGRDFYDLIWYLNHKIPINLSYLGNAKLKFKDNLEVIEVLKKRIDNVSINDIMKDLSKFLEDPSDDEAWIGNYHLAFSQAAMRYLDKGVL